MIAGCWCESTSARPRLIWIKSTRQLDQSLLLSKGKINAHARGNVFYSADHNGNDHEGELSTYERGESQAGQRGHQQAPSARRVCSNSRLSTFIVLKRFRVSRECDSSLSTWSYHRDSRVVSRRTVCDARDDLLRNFDTSLKRCICSPVLERESRATSLVGKRYWSSGISQNVPIKTLHSNFALFVNRELCAKVDDWVEEENRRDKVEIESLKNCQGWTVRDLRIR